MTNRTLLVVGGIAALAAAVAIAHGGRDARLRLGLEEQLRGKRLEVERQRVELEQRKAEAQAWKSKAEKATEDLAPYENARNLFERGGRKVEKGCFRLFQIFSSRAEGLAHECGSHDITHLSGLPASVVDDQELNLPAYRAGVYQYRDKKENDHTVANWVIWHPASSRNAD